MREQPVEALAVIETLRAENEALHDRVAALQAELSKDSSRSSKPPSTDPVGLRKKPAERRAEARAGTRGICI